MATQEELWRIYQIQQVGAEMAALQRERASLDDGSALAEEVARRQRAAATFQETAQKAESVLRDAELELATLEEKLQRVRGILYSGRVNNPKELQGYEAEVESLRRHKEVLEDQVLARMETGETAKERLATARQSANRAHRRWQARASAYREDLAALTAREEALARRREELRAGADPDLLRRYDLAQRLRKLLVGIVEEEVCGACGLRLPGRLVKEYKTHPDAELTCPTCGADLLWRVPDSTTALTASERK